MLELSIKPIIQGQNSVFFQTKYNEVDAEEESFELRYKATNLREKQKLGYVNIPIGIQFEIPGRTKLYLTAEGKIGFGVSGSYQTTISILQQVVIIWNIM